MSSGADRHTRFEAYARTVWVPLQAYVRRRAGRDDVDDIVTDTLTVAWRRLDDIPQEAVVPWTLAVARRTLANHRRSHDRRRALAARLDEQPPAVPADTAGDAELEAALALLPDDDREVLHLWAWEQLEPRDLAVVLGLTPNTAAARLSRAKRRLRNLLDSRHDPGAGGHSTGGAGRERSHDG